LEVLTCENYKLEILFEDGQTVFGVLYPHRLKEASVGMPPLAAYTVIVIRDYATQEGSTNLLEIPHGIDGFHGNNILAKVARTGSVI
jgi:hypothetical protein